jgi:hypothetical protein
MEFVFPLGETFLRNREYALACRAGQHLSWLALSVFTFEYTYGTDAIRSFQK